MVFIESRFPSIQFYAYSLTAFSHTTADFGMARPFTSRPLTPDVVTVWYRPPEILLGCVRYTKASDIWSTGLIMGELLLLVPLLPGSSEPEQLGLITSLLGPPTDETWPNMRLLPRFSSKLLYRKDGKEKDSLEYKFRGHTKETVLLLREMLIWDPERRISAKKALEHRWFRYEQPRAKDSSGMPTFPELRNGEGVTEQFDAMVVDEEEDKEAQRGYVGGGRSMRGDDAGKGKGRRYEDVGESGGAAATVAAAVMKRGAAAVAGAGAGGLLFDFGDEYRGGHGNDAQGGGRYAKKSRY